MREVQKIREKSSLRERRDPKRWIPYAAVAGCLLFLAIFLFVWKGEIGHPPSDQPGGKIYTEGNGEIKGGEEDAGETQDVEKPESFTFYKSLSSKEGGIVPLKKEVEKSIQKTIKPEPLMEKRSSSLEKKLGKELKEMATTEVYYTVQVAALTSNSRARALVRKLKQQGYRSFITKVTDKQGRPLYRIRVGKFPSLVDAREMAGRLKKDGYETYLIKEGG